MMFVGGCYSQSQLNIWLHAACGRSSAASRAVILSVYTVWNCSQIADKSTYRRKRLEMWTLFLFLSLPGCFSHHFSSWTRRRCNLCWPIKWSPTEALNGRTVQTHLLLRMFIVQHKNGWYVYIIDTILAIICQYFPLTAILALVFMIHSMAAFLHIFNPYFSEFNFICCSISL